MTHRPETGSLRNSGASGLASDIVSLQQEITNLGSKGAGVAVVYQCAIARRPALDNRDFRPLAGAALHLPHNQFIFLRGDGRFDRPFARDALDHLFVAE